MALLVTAALAGATLTPALFAQANDPAPRASATGDAAIAALVTELRAIRQELANAARASARTQLLLARLQLQEQRIMHLDRQRAEVSAKVREAERAVTQTMMGFQAMGGRVDERPGASAEQREEQRQMAMMLETMKVQIAQQQAAEQSLRAEEGELLNALSTEQARWSDFNSRLDELERSLPQR
jgi:chromosome segregation ATPase